MSMRSMPTATKDAGIDCTVGRVHGKRFRQSTEYIAGKSARKSLALRGRVAPRIRVKGYGCEIWGQRERASYFQPVQMLEGACGACRKGILPTWKERGFHRLIPMGQSAKSRVRCFVVKVTSKIEVNVSG